MLKDNISFEKIQEATAPKSKTSSEMIACIKTDEKEYCTEKKATSEYHYIS